MGLLAKASIRYEGINCYSNMISLFVSQVLNICCFSAPCDTIPLLTEDLCLHLVEGVWENVFFLSLTVLSLMCGAVSVFESLFRWGSIQNAIVEVRCLP